MLHIKCVMLHIRCVKGDANLRLTPFSDLCLSLCSRSKLLLVDTTFPVTDADFDMERSRLGSHAYKVSFAWCVLKHEKRILLEEAELPAIYWLP